MGINASGQVVGAVWDVSSQDTHAFLYSGGVMLDLNSLLDASGSGYTFEEAKGIADNGMIAATGLTPSGESHAVLLTPNAGVAGTVSLQSFTGDVTQVPVVIEIRSPGTTAVVQTQTVRLNANGTFQFCTTLSGTYDVAVKASHWLRKTISNVTLTGDSFTSGVNFSLINGDVNGDNTINLADLMAVSAAWRSTSGSSNWNPNADLNGDGVVNLADWMIVAKNWRKSGDP
jgi:probable HAF family extracellular repeat protein